MMETIDFLIAKHQRKTIRIALVFLLLLLVEYQNIGISFFDLRSEELITINTIIFIYILYSITIVIPDGSSFSVYEDQLSLDKELSDYITKSELDEAILIQYSGQMVTPTVLALMKKGVKISLWLHNPETAISTHQKIRIQENVAGIQELFSNPNSYSNKSSLLIDSYDAPASVRGLLLRNNDKDKLLVIGWYTYCHNFPHKTGSDVYKISGHNMPSIMVNARHPDFDKLKQMFMGQLADYDENRIEENREPMLNLPLKHLPKNG